MNWLGFITSAACPGHAPPFKAKNRPPRATAGTFFFSTGHRAAILTRACEAGSQNETNDMKLSNLSSTAWFAGASPGFCSAQFLAPRKESGTSKPFTRKAGCAT
jgi:hypothetical protein